MTDGGSAPANRVSIVVTGLIAAALAVPGVMLLFAVLALGCSGSDAGAPSDAVVCKGATEWLLGIPLMVVGVVAPCVGTGLAFDRRVWKPLQLGIAAEAAAALLALLLAVLI